MSNAKSALTLATFAAAAPALLPVVAAVGGGVLLLSWVFSDDKPKLANGDASTAADAGGVPTSRRNGMFRRSSPATAAAPVRPHAVPVAARVVIAPAPRPEAPVSRPAPAPSLSMGNPPVLPRTQAKRASVSADDVRTVFASGPLSRKEAVAALCEHTGCGRSAAYQALAVGSRHSDLFTEGVDGRLNLSA